MLKSEQETTIRWDREERIAHIWTCDPTAIRRLDKLAFNFPDTYHLERADKYGKFYTAPMERIRFSKPSSTAVLKSRRENSPFVSNTSAGKKATE